MWRPRCRNHDRVVSFFISASIVCPGICWPVGLGRAGSGRPSASVFSLLETLHARLNPPMLRSFLVPNISTTTRVDQPVPDAQATHDGSPLLEPVGPYCFRGNIVPGFRCRRARDVTCWTSAVRRRPVLMMVRNPSFAPCSFASFPASASSCQHRRVVHRGLVRVAMCFFGTSMKCTGANGRISRKASTSGVLEDLVARYLAGTSCKRCSWDRCVHGRCRYFNR